MEGKGMHGYDCRKMSLPRSDHRDRGSFPESGLLDLLLERGCPCHARPWIPIHAVLGLRSY